MDLPQLARPLLDLSWARLSLDWTSTGPPEVLDWISTGPLRGLHWTSTGPLLDLYWISTGPPLGLYWISTGPRMDLDWTSTGSRVDLHWTSTGSRLDIYWISTGPILDLARSNLTEPTHAKREEPTHGTHPRNPPTRAWISISELRGMVPFFCSALLYVSSQLEASPQAALTQPGHRCESHVELIRQRITSESQICYSQRALNCFARARFC